MPQYHITGTLNILALGQGGIIVKDIDVQVDRELYAEDEEEAAGWAVFFTKRAEVGDFLPVETEWLDLDIKEISQAELLRRRGMQPLPGLE